LQDTKKKVEEKSERESSVFFFSCRFSGLNPSVKISRSASSHWQEEKENSERRASKKKRRRRRRKNETC
jgi:hypothetical protein